MTPSIVCFGDSITYGQGLDDPSRDAYPAVLERELGVRVANRGYCGDTTRIALERFPRDVQESGASVVVIQFGHNDANTWASDRGLPRVSREAFAANLAEMVDRAQMFGIRSVLLAPYYPAKPMARLPEYRGAIDTLAAQNAAIVAVFPVLAPDADLLDHIHPNRSGHRVIADALLPYLDAVTP